jgi:hypothetical protein
VSAPVRPADRYGDRRWNRRWLIPLVAIAVAAAVVVVMVIVNLADRQIQSSVTGYQQPEDDIMTATIEVTRQPSQAVTCDLVAVDLRQVIVGQTEVYVAPSETRQVDLEVEIPLQGDAVAARIQQCRPAD